MHKAVFEGLVYDEQGRAVEVVQVGAEPHYVVDDQGMKFHIPSERVDRQVLAVFRTLMEGQEDLISQETARLLGQDDPFTRAAIAHQLQHLDEHLEQLLTLGLPEDVRLWLGLMGFRVTINFRGEVLDVHIPGAGPDDEPDAWDPDL